MLSNDQGVPNGHLLITVPYAYILQHLLEDLQAHHQLARTIVYQNEQLRDHEITILTPEEVYEQDSLHNQLLKRLDGLYREVDHRYELCSPVSADFTAPQPVLLTT